MSFINRTGSKESKEAQKEQRSSSSNDVEERVDSASIMSDSQRYVSTKAEQ